WHQAERKCSRRARPLGALHQHAHGESRRGKGRNTRTLLHRPRRPYRPASRYEVLRWRGGLRGWGYGLQGQITIDQGPKPREVSSDDGRTRRLLRSAAERAESFVPVRPVILPAVTDRRESSIF